MASNYQHMDQQANNNAALIRSKHFFTQCSYVHSPHNFDNYIRDFTDLRKLSIQDNFHVPHTADCDHFHSCCALVCAALKEKGRILSCEGREVLANFIFLLRFAYILKDSFVLCSSVTNGLLGR
jgi:hypothetical protein